MSTFLRWIDGKKTYIGIVIGIVYSLLTQYGVTENNETIWAIIVGWTGVSVRLAIKKIEK